MDPEHGPDEPAEVEIGLARLSLARHKRDIGFRARLTRTNVRLIALGNEPCQVEWLRPRI